MNRFLVPSFQGTKGLAHIARVRLQVKKKNCYLSLTESRDYGFLELYLHNIEKTQIIYGSETYVQFFRVK